MTHSTQLINYAQKYRARDLKTAKGSYCRLTGTSAPRSYPNQSYYYYKNCYCSNVLMLKKTVKITS